MKDEILTYLEMCRRERTTLQRGMNFKAPPEHGVILMSRRSNAPYSDAMNDDGTVLLYEGHDAQRTSTTPDPKSLDQPRVEADGRLTQNGRFADWVDANKSGRARPAIFRVYEKMRDGVWTDRGLYVLRDYEYHKSGPRKVFTFRLEEAEAETASGEFSADLDFQHGRQMSVLHISISKSTSFEVDLRRGLAHYG